jgi:hypothetical protein
MPFQLTEAGRFREQKKIQGQFVFSTRLKFSSPNRHTFVADLKLCDEFARAMMLR